MKSICQPYCQFLLLSQINHTLTYFADHQKTMSHDFINRRLREETLTPRLVWENVRDAIVPSEAGYLAFDDTILDKDFSDKIELVKRQYSGNAHGVIKGIGVVTCVYINPETQEHWLIDYRIFDKEGDGKSKLDHAQEMLDNALYAKALPFKTVLMDAWYATKKLMCHIESLGLIYYCPMKSNRQVADEHNRESYERVDELTWNGQQQEKGQIVKIKGFPKMHRVKLFRLEVSKSRTDWVVTNDLSQHSTEATRSACGLRWKIEQFHRELKQLTGVEKCQCRKARIQRNHIACAMLVWVQLAKIAKENKQTLYQVKAQLLDEFMQNQLKNPSLKMCLAQMRECKSL